MTNVLDKIIHDKKEFLKILDLVRVYVASHISGAI